MKTKGRGRCLKIVCLIGICRLVKYDLPAKGPGDVVRVVVRGKILAPESEVSRAVATQHSDSFDVSKS